MLIFGGLLWPYSSAQLFDELGKTAGQSEVIAEEETESPVEARLTVQMRPGVDEGWARRYFSERGFRPLRYLHQINVWVLILPDNLRETWSAHLGDDGRVVWAEEDGLVYASEVVPDDNFYQAQQENLRVIGLPEAWVFTTGDQLPVAMIDSGVDLDHPDLGDKVWINPDEIPDNGEDDDLNGFVDDVRGWNFVSGNNNPQDDNSHGSHIAGTAAAETNNSIGIAGVSWGAKIMAVKVLNHLAVGQASDAAAGILYAVDEGARILNLSWGDAQEYQAITDAVQYALSNGCVVIAAVGNNASAVDYPAATEGVLAVSATTNSDIPWGYTNRGLQVDVAAPGEDILSASNIGSYFVLSGTSMSTAHVSGLTALVWSLRPEWPAIQVTQVISSTAKDVWSPGKDSLTGWGRIDAQLAVKASLYYYYFPFFPDN